MVEFDSTGYMAGRPFRPEQWRTVSKDEPDGAIVVRNTVPPGFFLAQNYLSASECDAIVNECNNLEGARHTVGSQAGGPGLTTQHGAGRTSEMVDIRLLQADIKGLVQKAYVEAVAPHFGVEIESFELPEILRYKTGGEYRPHADADNWVQQEQKWTRVIDRDLSILIYLNEGYSGGEIVFPNFGLSLPPKRGLLIAFPSDCRYLHAAMPVKVGVRYALVSWAAVRGSKRVTTEPRPHAIIL